MKRTKQAYFRPNPTLQQTVDSSGLTFLIGQDHPNLDRKKDYQNLQKQYLDEQMKEKKMIKDNVKNTNSMFDQQLLTNTHHRGQLQIEKKTRLFNMEKATDDHNLQMANERKNRQRQQRQKQLQQERRQLDLLNQRKVKRVLPNQK